MCYSCIAGINYNVGTNADGCSPVTVKTCGTGKGLDPATSSRDAVCNNSPSERTAGSGLRSSLLFRHVYRRVKQLEQKSQETLQNIMGPFFLRRRFASLVALAAA